LLNDEGALGDAVDVVVERDGRLREHASFGNEDAGGRRGGEGMVGGEDGSGRREDQDGNVKAGIGRAWNFGGTATREGLGAGVAVCKHILAAVVAKAAPSLFVEGVNVHIKGDVGMEEMAGWGAGWGDGG
jgi:hypothetical protein